MKGLVLVWSSQIPRPQNRHAPRAVLRQCQQSMSGPLLDDSIRGCDAQRAAAERARDHLVESRTVDREQPGGSARAHRCSARNVQQQRNLAEVVTGPEIAD